ncbi:DUF1631 domain-containing protein [Teredinibacter purpureus]|uniref:DUF1631 domain-containing protein n=1 Tax=Teredinibacter purpureus TaxID=2731756 RepID=UPI0005F87C03|nr:DUF1631 domain-containing protein [Teredinibacter purpureus]
MAPRKERPDHLELVGKRYEGPKHPPKLLEHIRNQSSENAARLLEHMFAATDDLFYDLSKRATNNNEQNLYFESMREVRIQKRGVANDFAHELNNAYSQLLESQDNKPAPVADDSSTLSIVEGDQLETELALSNMSGRTRESYKQELYELTIRLDHLLLQVRVTEGNNPLDPSVLAGAFVQACENQLKLDIKARLILFKLFEKHVLKQLGNIYSEANEILIEAGILPKVPRHLNKSSSSERPSTQPEQEPTNSGSEQTPHQDEALGAAQPPQNIQLDLSTLGALMAGARTNTHASASGDNSSRVTGPYTYYLYSSNPGPIMASPQLATLLTKSQPLVDRQLSSAQPRNVISDVVNQLLAKRDPEVPQALEQPDEDIINLIAMFFDNVLSDNNLPIAVQSLICRLQIPVLKIALRDRSFLTDADHSARKLINAITRAGLSFDETKPLERDPLYRIIADGVQTINRLYRTSSSVIEEFLAQLEDEMKRERRKSDLVEKRTTQAEEGKSKIRQARASAQNALYNKLKSAQLPEQVTTFLTNTWLQVLVITHLKHGYNSAEWVEAETLVNDVIWICQPHTDERSISRKQRLQPEVLQRIENGMEIAIDNPETRAAKIAAIEETLAQLTEPGGDPLEYCALTTEQRESLGKGDTQQKSWEEMTALERQQSRYEELSNHFYLEAKNLPAGSWLEYFNDETSKHQRCKLSSKLDTESYIFVNRFGFKILEKSRRQLAYDMQFEKAKVLDSRPLFERLMTKVVSHLKQSD